MVSLGRLFGARAKLVKHTAGGGNKLNIKDQRCARNTYLQVGVMN